jgi:dynein heavy chain
LKQALQVEIKAWKMLFGKHLNLKYKAMMDQVVEFEDELSLKLSRPIKDLEDVRQAMAALETIRQKQIEIDMHLGPIEVCF